MAKKKKENTLSYLQMPLPEGGKYSKMTKVSFGGLNKRYTHDSGYLSTESNISTNEYPYLTPSAKAEAITEERYSYPISMFAFDDFLVVVYYDGNGGNKIKIDYITPDGSEYKVYTGLLKSSENGFGDDDLHPRSIVQFNKYDESIDIVNGSYVKKLLIFPDCMDMFMNIVEVEGSYNNWSDEEKQKARTDVLYYNSDNDTYFTLSYDDKGQIETNGSGGTGYFAPESMKVDVKEYYNDKPEVDASGAIIYPPPDTANHNCYYKNTYKHKDTGNGTDIYKWCEYETLKRDEEWGLKKDDKGKLETDEDGNYIVYGFDEKYIKDGGITNGWKVSIPPTMPILKYATVHLSRVFGVSDDCVYASGFNDYTNWNLDSIDEYNESNSWFSQTQSNTKADGNFTGITTFQGHVVCFKRDFMHEIYNTKNPFRLIDIYAEGAIDNRTIQDVDGKLIFVSEDAVKIYTGSNPRIISYELNMPKYTYAVSGTDNRNYYLYCEDDNNIYLYVYDTYTELWSEQSITHRVLNFAHNKNGMYMLCSDGNGSDGYVYKMDTDTYRHNWSFETELITNQTVDIKHVKKLQMLVDIPEEINGIDNLADDKANPAYMNVYILYDDEVFDGLTDIEKKERLKYSSTKRGKFPIRVKPRKTANYGFKLHFEGAGYVKIYELEIFIESGGDLFV